MCGGFDAWVARLRSDASHRGAELATCSPHGHRVAEAVISKTRPAVLRLPRVLASAAPKVRRRGWGKCRAARISPHGRWPHGASRRRSPLSWAATIAWRSPRCGPRRRRSGAGTSWACACCSVNRPRQRSIARQAWVPGNWGSGVGGVRAAMYVEAERGSAKCSGISQASRRQAIRSQAGPRPLGIAQIGSVAPRHGDYADSRSNMLHD